jgi:hypothetical protein
MWYQKDLFIITHEVMMQEIKLRGTGIKRRTSIETDKESLNQNSHHISYFELPPPPPQTHTHTHTQKEVNTKHHYIALT